MSRRAYSDTHENTLYAANNFGDLLIESGRAAEARPILLKYLQKAKHKHGDEYENTLLLRETYAQALYKDDKASESDRVEAEAMLETLLKRKKHIWNSSPGDGHGTSRPGSGKDPAGACARIV